MEKKNYETLLTNEECSKAIDMGDFYRVPCDKRTLNYDNYLSKGIDRNGLSEFNSNNTKLLSIDETVDKLFSIDEVKEALRNYKK